MKLVYGVKDKPSWGKTIVFALQQMDEKLLVKVLKEPKNAIVKQYKKLFAMDGVKLDFDEDALLEMPTGLWRKRRGREHCVRYWKRRC